MTARQQLDKKVVEINTLLGRPVEQFSSAVGETTTFSVGHICLDKNIGGYAIEEQTGIGGSTSRLSLRMPAKMISLHMDGIITGARLARYNK